MKLVSFCRGEIVKKIYLEVKKIEIIMLKLAKLLHIQKYNSSNQSEYSDSFKLSKSSLLLA